MPTWWLLIQINIKVLIVAFSRLVYATTLEYLANVMAPATSDQARQPLRSATQREVVIPKRTKFHLQERHSNVNRHLTAYCQIGHSKLLTT